MEKSYSAGLLHELRLECFDCYNEIKTATENIEPTTEKAYQEIAEKLVANFMSTCGVPFYLEIRDYPWDAENERALASISTIDALGNDVVDYNKGGELALLHVRQEYFAYHRPTPEKSHKGRTEIDLYIFKCDGQVPTELQILADQTWQSIYAIAGATGDWQTEYLGYPEEFNPFESAPEPAEETQESA